jgi:hypothetical protein
MINPTKRCSTLLPSMFALKWTILFAALVAVSGIFPETATAQSIGGSGFGRYLIPSFSRFPETQPAPKTVHPQQKPQTHRHRKPTVSRRAK